VHFLLMICRAKYFFKNCANKSRAISFVHALSYVASLDRHPRVHTLVPAPNTFSLATHVNISVHRFEETIGGRPYLIEVKSVAHDRWRAYIVRLPGVPTALMPFYGPTPAEAARQLSSWLTRAHERVSKPGGSV
jgi:hypothetical protein